MKLAFSTLGSPSWSFEEILNNAQQMGFQAIELRGIQDEMRAERLTPFLPENVQDTKAALEARGLTLCCLGTSINFDKDTSVDGIMDEARAAIDVCRRMNIPALRVFGNTIKDGETADEAIARVSEGLSMLCNSLGDAPVRILLEVHGDYDRVERLLPIMEAVNHSQCGLLWDIHHSHKVYGENFEAFFQPLKPYIHHIHVKDCTKEGQLCPVGKGDLPIAAIVNMLQDSGYEGYYSLEWEKRWMPALAEPEAVFPAYVQWMQNVKGR